MAEASEIYVSPNSARLPLAILRQRASIPESGMTGSRGGYRFALVPVASGASPNLISTQGSPFGTLVSDCWLVREPIETAGLDDTGGARHGDNQGGHRGDDGTGGRGGHRHGDDDDRDNDDRDNDDRDNDEESDDESAPCFVAGTRIFTARGPLAIERIRVGDLVETLDDGYQPVRWCGGRRVRSSGNLAAVVIPAGTFGDHNALRVSPQHRLHMAGWRSELYCGTLDVLVKAVHLVQAGLLAQDHSGAEICYHHLLFDRHQIICAEGLWSESYLPGPLTLAGHDAETRAELLRLFPDLGNPSETGYGPAARPEVAAAAARLLV